jgi:hypothetical protein
LGIANLSAPLKQQILAWVQQQAEDRVTAKRNP